MYGWRGRIGLIVPSSNTTMESEFWRWVPEGVTVHTARMPLVAATPETLVQMSQAAEECADMLSHAAVRVMVYGCTTGSLIKGAGFERELRQRLTAKTGIATVTTSGAIVRAMKALGIMNVTVVTPYMDELNMKVKSFLEDSGFRVQSVRGLALFANTDIGRQEPIAAYRMACESAASSDGILISCTNLRSFEILRTLSDDLGIPVVSSNQASLWAALREIGLRGDAQRLGDLFLH